MVKRCVNSMDNKNLSISLKMRELGQFMLAVRVFNSEVKSLTDVCHSAKFKLAIAAVKKANGFDASKKASTTPLLASKLGYTLKKACEITVGESLMNDNAETEQKAKNLIK